jgi:hypothetical protein
VFAIIPSRHREAATSIASALRFIADAVGKELRVAIVELSRERMQKGLPAVCMKCGAPATIWKDQSYEVPSTNPIARLSSWVRLATSFFRRNLTVKAPFCTAHQHHWSRRKLVTVGGLMAVLAILLGGTTLCAIVGWDRSIPFMVGMGFFFAWCVAAVIAYETSIHPTLITEHDVSLKGVSDRFVSALDEHRR